MRYSTPPPRNPAQDLRNNVRRQIPCRKATANPETDGDCRFKWQPEMCPMAKAIVSTVNPKASETPQQTNAHVGKCRASTALPQPPRTSQNVPKTPRRIASCCSPCVSGQVVRPRHSKCRIQPAGDNNPVDVERTPSSCIKRSSFPKKRGGVIWAGGRRKLLFTHHPWKRGGTTSLHRDREQPGLTHRIYGFVLAD